MNGNPQGKPFLQTEKLKLELGAESEQEHQSRAGPKERCQTSKMCLGEGDKFKILTEAHMGDDALQRQACQIYVSRSKRLRFNK